ncbi:hypothetical protein TNCV_1596281 [Trichonephila clavipes]|nr:hypothetical protein TNCV_1596281 [Trichonephila clavipes]
MPQCRLSLLCDFIHLKIGFLNYATTYALKNSFPILWLMCLKRALPVVMAMMPRRGPDRCYYEGMLTSLLTVNIGHREKMNVTDYDIVMTWRVWVRNLMKKMTEMANDLNAAKLPMKRFYFSKIYSNSMPDILIQKCILSQ